MRYITYFLILVVIVLGVTFAILNSSKVTLNYYLGQRDLPLSLLLVIDFAIGCMVGLTASFWMMLATKMKNRQLQKQLKTAEKEIENLRAIPIQDKH